MTERPPRPLLSIASRAARVAFVPCMTCLLVTAAVSLVVVPGCSGAETQDVFDPAAAPSATATASGGPGNGNDSGNSSGGRTDAAADTSAVCPEEHEPNDKPEQANALAPRLCGSIAPNSDVDYVAFQLQPQSTSMQVTFDGKVELTIEVNGKKVVLGQAPVPFEKGKTYLIEIKPTTKMPRTPWRVDLAEQ